MRSKNKLVHPIFMLSIFALIINDFFLKYIFHNTITGKLSDLAGLFAFPFFWSAIFPKQAKFIHFLTVIFFVFWKSALSQPLIDLINLTGLNTFRTIDFTDNIALISVLFSYFLITKPFLIKVKPVLLKFLFSISVFSFVATTQKRDAPTIEEEFKSIDIYNQGIESLYVIIDFKYSDAEIAADTSMFNSHDTLRNGIIKRYNRIDTVKVSPGANERIITPIFQDSTKFPASFKVGVLDTLGKVIKQYSKVDFFKALDTNYKQELPNEYASNWKLTIGRKKPEMLAQWTLYGRWKAITPFKKHSSFEIRQQYYYDVDPDGEILKYSLQDSTINILYGKQKVQGRILHLDNSKLIMKWNNRQVVEYKKLYN